MSLSPTSSETGPRPVRAGVAVAVAIAVLAPLAVLFAQVWTSTGRSLAFTAAERRGVAYLGPMTELLSVVTEAQSAAVRGRPVDPAAVRAAIAGVDDVDRRLGVELRTTERWTTIRRTVEERTARRWPQPSIAYSQYSDLVTGVMELNRKVGDNSKLILDPELDAYYVMNASLLRIPEILADSGRYADLSVLASASGTPDRTMQAQLAAARNRIATNAADLGDGLVKAFAETASTTLGPALTRQLDNFRTAVDAVAPSSSLLAPPPERSLPDLATDQDVLQRTALDLQRASLAELDQLLRAREDATGRIRLIALLAAAVGVLVAVGAGIGWRPVRLHSADVPETDRPDPTPVDRTARPRGPATGENPDPRRAYRPAPIGSGPAGPPGPADELGLQHPGGARAAR